MIYLALIPYGLIYTYLAYRLGAAIEGYRAYDKIMKELHEKLAETRIAKRGETDE